MDELTELRQANESLRSTLRMVTKCVIDLAPYPPEVTVGVVAIVDMAREELAKHDGVVVAQ